MEYYRRGQIVPHALVKVKPRSLQHLIKFGSDVKVHGRTIEAVDKSSKEPMFVIDKQFKVGRKGSPNRYPNFNLIDLNLIGSGGAMFSVLSDGPLAHDIYEALLPLKVGQTNKEG